MKYLVCTYNKNGFECGEGESGLAFNSFNKAVKKYKELKKKNYEVGLNDEDGELILNSVKYGEEVNPQQIEVK